MSPLTLGRRRLRFPDPPCPRGSSLWTHDVRMRVPQGGEPTSWEQKPAMLVPGKSLRSPSKTGAMPLVRVHQVRRSKQRKRPGLSPASKKSEVIHPGETAPVLWLGMLLRDWCLSLHQRFVLFSALCSPLRSLTFFSFFSFLLPFRQISFIRGITRHVHAA